MKKMNKEEKESKIRKFFRRFEGIGVIYALVLMVIVYSEYLSPKFTLGWFNYFFHITFILGMFGLFLLFFEDKFSEGNT